MSDKAFVRWLISSILLNRPLFLRIDGMSLLTYLSILKNWSKVLDSSQRYQINGFLKAIILPLQGTFDNKVKLHLTRR